MNIGKQAYLEMILSTPSQYFEEDFFRSQCSFLSPENWISYLEKSIRFRSYMVFFENLKKIGMNPPEEYSILKMHWGALKQNYSRDVVDQLNTLGVRYCFLKSFNLFEYADKSFIENRVFSDIDILYDEENIELARSFFLDNGFFHAKEEGDRIVPIQPNLELEREHYEITPLYKAYPIDLSLSEMEILKIFRFPVKRLNHQNCLMVKVDIHKSISSDVESSHNWTSFSFRKKGLLWYFSPEDLLWYLSLKLYYETHNEEAPHPMRRFRNMTDIVAILHNCKNDFSWNYLSRKVEEFNIETPLFYVLSTLEQIFNIYYPSEIKNKLLQKSFHQRSKDYGPFLLKLLNHYPQNTIDIN